jgi:hypothetical protein
MRFVALVKCPILTLSERDIATAMKARAAFTACGATATYMKATSPGREYVGPDTVELYSTGTCSVPITGVASMLGRSQPMRMSRRPRSDDAGRGHGRDAAGCTWNLICDSITDGDLGCPNIGNTWCLRLLLVVLPVEFTRPALGDPVRSERAHGDIPSRRILHRPSGAATRANLDPEHDRRATATRYWRRA